MLRRRHLLALALAAATGVAGRAIASPPPAKPKPPEPPTSGPGSDATPFPRATEETFANPVRPDLLVHVFRPAGAEEPPERLPVVLFVHGFSVTDPSPYGAWLEHMAREGTFVVFPIYPGLEATKVPRYDVVWAGFEEALRRLDAGPTKPDRARVGFVGHSFGGGAAPAMAARAAARGMGRDAMWIESLAPWYDLDRSAWAVLPANATLLAISFCDDSTCDVHIAQSFVRLATTIPEERKRLVVFRTDDHGWPPLRATHLTPVTFFGADDYDRRGTWRLDDALRVFALTGDAAAKAIAFGTDSDPAPLGAWSDGVPVAKPTFGAAPDSQPPILKWREGGPAEVAGRLLGRDEAWSTLPLPSPEVAPASRLPASGRLVRPPPTQAWPDDVAAAAKSGPVLVVVSARAGATTAALDAAAPALERRGVKVVRAAPDTPLGAMLGPRADPSVVLVGKGGGILLWREGEEPHLVAAIEDLAK